MDNVLWNGRHEKIILEEGRAYSYISPFVIVVPVFKDGRVLVIKQYRPGMKEKVYGFPGGYLEEGESEFSGAMRELYEETGYKATNIDLPVKLYENPSRCREPFSVVFVTVCDKPDNVKNPDPHEPEIEVEIVDPSFLTSHEYFKQCRNAVTLAATYLFLHEEAHA